MPLRTISLALIANSDSDPSSRNSAKYSSTCYSAPALPCCSFPRIGTSPAPSEKRSVAWDGGASAARAVRDALPLLAAAEMVEVVSVLGEKDITAEASGADIARHLTRHCPEVCVNVLPVGEDGVAATLFAHGILTRADLMVMGGYGHSRLREFILGGVTRDTLARTDIPTLLSH